MAQWVVVPATTLWAVGSIPRPATWKNINVVVGGGCKIIYCWASPPTFYNFVLERAFCSKTSCFILSKLSVLCEFNNELESTFILFVLSICGAKILTGSYFVLTCNSFGFAFLPTSLGTTGLLYVTTLFEFLPTSLARRAPKLCPMVVIVSLPYLADASACTY